MKARIITVIIFALCFLGISAQNTDDVTLVVSASGETEELAVKNALRDAIEQTYGTFVSSNTSILNDELVKDEVVTISTGNIKEYSKISSIENNNGGVTVTLNVTVSISSLINYARSKGASAEFAGASFAMNIKMYELNKKAELKALDYLLVTLEQQLPLAFDRNIQIEDPIIPDRFGFEYDDHSDQAFASILLNRLTKPQYSEYDNVSDDLIQLMSPDKDDEELFDWAIYAADTCYQVSMIISYDNNDNTESILDNIVSTLDNISVKDNELSNSGRDGQTVSSFSFDYNGHLYKTFHFRNSSEEINNFGRKLLQLFDKAFGEFYVVDNLGGRSLFKLNSRIDGNIEKSDRLLSFPSGVLSPKSMVAYSLYTYQENDWEEGSFTIFDKRKIKLTFFIPKDKIASYTNFSIEKE